MKPLHKIILVGTTFVLAAATGHVMQNSAQYGLEPGTAAPQQAAQSAQAAPVQLARQVRAAPDLPMPPAMRAPGRLPDLGALPQDGAQTGGFAAIAPAANTTDPSGTDTAEAAEPACAAPQLTAEAAPMASVRLTVVAPCQPSLATDIRTEGLRLPIVLSDEGRWSGIVPALSTEAVYAVMLPKGTMPAMAQVAVPDVAEVNRIAITIGNAPGFALHGYEYGSMPDGAGDVSLANPRDAMTALGGWMMAFDAPGARMPVQIYTVPASMSDVRLALELPVTAQTCGGTKVGAVLRQMAGRIEDDTVLRLEMPACDDGGGYVLMPLPDFPVSLATAG
ncbi:hypothetical protein CKO11_00430 [Rhodobacter sp. TJ_12]|uniref:hypothetical protein n=1 Tax=Rhodobacter sp. TJ_12 TaxID=2029399 RepID=UPI001CBDB22A|nr:hypothetical protein [Rhodobacter sp. TJ_12]MBZ4020925.1 hypothetical protein [Rhodobacter sp. TJ_12]